jgi:radical SAM family uncharacterized protein
MNNRLQKILPLVVKPIRYTGGEYNISLKKFTKDRVKVCLILPEVYEIGMSNYGLKILYWILNRKENIICERAYAPWTDFGLSLKLNSVPLYSLETKQPLKSFDILGFSLQSELSYTNILYVLDLSEVPLYSYERTLNDPLIIAGGPCATNPLPLKDFIDCFVIGDGEEVILEIVEVFRNWDRKNRNTLLTELSKLEGVYVPLINDRNELKIKKRTIKELKDADFPYPPVVPICEVIHDRLTVEISRGCIQGCRFCQAGMINRPYRIRPIKEIVQLSKKGLDASGWEEVSLLALSASDYPNLTELVKLLASKLSKKKIAISLPSMRGEDFSLELAEYITTIRKTGLTFAPETSSARLKAFINKQISEDKIFCSVENALKAGWRHIKLYFMIGLPGEEDKDLEEIVYFIRSLSNISSKLNIKVSFSTFIPKPHTPLQWAQFISPEMIQEKIRFLTRRLKMRNVSISWDSPEVSLIQAVLARGDEKLSSVIKEVYEKDGVFQEWTEVFLFARWQEAFSNHDVDYNFYLQAKSPDEKLPWDFIDIGVSKEFLQAEYQKAQIYRATENCQHFCAGCGISNCELITKDKWALKKDPTAIFNEVFELKTEDLSDRRFSNSLNIKIRVKYQVQEDFRYAGHLDRIRAIYRALRRTDLPIAYSQGFSPHPIVAFGPPLPVGLLSDGEYMDIELTRFYNGNLTAKLNEGMPQGIFIKEAQIISRKEASLGKLCNLALYEISEIPWVSELNLELLEGRKHQIPGLFRLEFLEHRLMIYLAIAPKIKLFDVLSKLFEKSEQEVRLLNIIRRDFYYLNENGEITGILAKKL